MLVKASGCVCVCTCVWPNCHNQPPSLTEQLIYYWFKYRANKWCTVYPRVKHVCAWVRVCVCVSLKPGSAADWGWFCLINENLLLLIDCLHYTDSDDVIQGAAERRVGKWDHACKAKSIFLDSTTACIFTVGLLEMISRRTWSSGSWMKLRSLLSFY